eukprot:TRINITY_DN150_c1_g1_i1.p1 TRINITY_DN150_c1_g1~~TRINITY_DN150_c1_g1_i1.p1  ORF type:complete len:469 (+),score=122.38 TRINITY_DN150_c1_g1_i1:34-1407(+)
MAFGGIVTVTIVEASKLPLQEEPIFVVATLDKQSVKTKSVDATENPKWGETFKFDVTNQNSELHMAIWTGKGDNFLGQVVLPVIMLRGQSGSSPVLRLEKRKWRLADKVVGDLHITLNWEDVVGKRVGVADFEIMKVLGRGGFGKVTQARKKDTGRIYAMKAIRKEHVVQRNEVDHTLSEKDVLAKVNHPFIISLKFAFQTEDRLYLVLDFCNGGELFYHLQQEEKFTEARARFYAAEIVLALGYLHEMGVIYRDLKPENLLLDSFGHIVMTDFGLCKQGIGIGEETSTFCGSLAYMAPEVLDPPASGGYGHAVDWWSLGCLLYEMMAGMPPFYSQDQHEMANMIRSKKLEFPASFSEDAKSLISGLLQRDPKQRLRNVNDIKAHPFFKTIDWNQLYQRRVDTPFRPQIKSASDVSNFDQEFTSEAPIESVVDSRLSASIQQNFQGFTYTNPAEHMK